MINVIPSPILLSGIVAGLSLPPLLGILSHGPWKIQSPARRFQIAVLGISMVWGLFSVTQESLDGADVLASLMLWLTAVLATFTFWSLLAWGFTLSLLLRLASAQRPLTVDEWIASYAQGGDAETFARDRLGILFRFRLARLDGDHVRLTPGLGPWAASLVDLFRSIYGVQG